LGGGRGAIGAGQQLPPAIRERLQNATPQERQRIMQQLQQRARRGLNENYARELMELHTLGVDGGYSQKDVQEVARALTGWTFNRQTGEFVFNPAIHDAGEKLILGQKFPAGHGEDEGERVLDMLARHPSTARFITTKLARHFVSDEPPKALVDRCAGTFSKSDGDIRKTLRCVVTSPEFFSRSAYRAKVKTPFELVASALRAVNAEPDTTPRTAQIVARLGQPIFGRQTPDGWPDHGDAWMNTGAILNRINFGLALAAGQLPGAPLSNWPDFATLRTQSRTQQVDAVVKSLLGGQVSPETRDVLMSGDNPMLGAAQAPADTVSMGGGRGRNPGGPPARALGGGRGGQLPGFGRPVNLQGLPQVVGLALGAPEFQRR
jgi:CRP-like cAMP-binding protein